MCQPRKWGNDIITNHLLNYASVLSSDSRDYEISTSQRCAATSDDKFIHDALRAGAETLEGSGFVSQQSSEASELESIFDSL